MNLASADMDFTQLEAFLTSQMKKRQASFCILAIYFIRIMIIPHAGGIV